jgi:hypothetical protein
VALVVEWIIWGRRWVMGTSSVRKRLGVKPLHPAQIEALPLDRFRSLG